MNVGKSVKTGLSLFMVPLEDQKLIAEYLRKKSWQIVANGQSGHLGGPSSSAELLTALYFGGFLKLDLDGNSHQSHDRVMIRGHLCPIRYAIFNLLGWVGDDELDNYRMIGSRLQGHEKMGLVTGIDITPSGALGLLLSYGTGSAVNAKVEGLNYRSFVFLGDGEEQEGNVSEAARHATSLKLDNLVCIIDKNGKQLSHPTEEVDAADLAMVWKGYGWEVFTITDGHDLNEINGVYNAVLRSSSRCPRVIIANTVKGKGLPGAERSPNGYHTANAFGADTLKGFVAGLAIPDNGEIRKVVYRAILDVSDSETKTPRIFNGSDFSMDQHLGDSVEGELALFFARSAALMSKDFPLYVMTSDLITSDETRAYGLYGQERYIDVGIREQHLFALAHGLSVTNPEARIVVKNHDAFLYRAADQIQAISQGKSRVVVLGDYAGLSGCYNGETHQSVGQLGTVLAMPGTEVFEPADAIDFWKVMNYALVENPGLVYVRLHSRGSKILPRISGQEWYYRTYESNRQPEVTLLSAGLSSNDVLEAAKLLDGEGVSAVVINVVRLNSILAPDFVRFLPYNTPILTVYNGNPYILQSLVSTAIMQFSEAVKSRVSGHGFTCGASGTMDDLKSVLLMDSKGIAGKAKEVLS